MYIHICVCICSYMYINICMHTDVQTYTSRYVYIHIYIVRDMIDICLLHIYLCAHTWQAHTLISLVVVSPRKGDITESFVLDWHSAMFAELEQTSALPILIFIVDHCSQELMFEPGHKEIDNH